MKGLPTEFDDLLQRGTHLLRAGEVGKALPMLRRAHEIDEENLDGALNLGSAYILLRKFRRAIPILERLSHQYPQNEMVWLNLGAAYLGNPVLATTEQQLRAIEAFQQALAVNPATPHAAYNIALIRRDRGETDEAIRWFQAALEANPRDGDARSYLQRLRARRDAA